MPLITVFITAYNSAAYIDQAIQSILSQTVQDFEVIVVDDGSTDDTQDVLSKIDDSRLRVLTNATNQGIVYSRNLALTEARGEFLAVLDSDDLALPNRLERQWNAFKDRENLALLGGRAYVIDDLGNLRGEIPHSPSGSDRNKASLFFENPFVHSSVMMRMSTFREVGGYPVLKYPVVEDLALYIEIAKKYDVDNLDEFICQYRRHDSNITKTSLVKVLAMMHQVKQDQLVYLGMQGAEDESEMLINYYQPNTFGIQEYADFLSTLIVQNRKSKTYHPTYFDKAIHQIWYDVVMTKSPHKSLSLLFKLPHHRWTYYSRSQLRKAFKRSVLPTALNKDKVVKIMGSLGDQMFQYVFLLALKQQGHTVKADLSNLTINSTQNESALEHVFSIRPESITDEERKLFIEKEGENAYWKIKRRILGTRKAFKTDQPPFSFHSHYLNQQSAAYYSGYWQHIDYMRFVKDEVSRVFKFPVVKTAHDLDIAKHISKSESIAVYVNRQNLEPHLADVCDLNYYRDSISYIEKRVENPVFYFFSDDMSWCKEHFSHLECCFFELNQGNDSYVDMQLMSLCNHQIIANNTFSWWAAWLNSNPEKVVVAPKNWANDAGVNTSGLTKFFVTL